MNIVEVLATPARWMRRQDWSSSIDKSQPFQLDNGDIAAVDWCDCEVSVQVTHAQVERAWKGVLGGIRGVTDDHLKKFCAEIGLT